MNQPQARNIQIHTTQTQDSADFPLQRSYSQPKINSPMYSSNAYQTSSRVSQNTNSPEGTRVSQTISRVMGRSKSKPVLPSNSTNRNTLQGFASIRNSQMVGVRHERQNSKQNFNNQREINIVSNYKVDSQAWKVSHNEITASINSPLEGKVPYYMTNQQKQPNQTDLYTRKYEHSDGKREKNTQQPYIREMNLSYHSHSHTPQTPLTIQSSNRNNNLNKIEQFYIATESSVQYNRPTDQSTMTPSSTNYRPDFSSYNMKNVNNFNSTPHQNLSRGRSRKQSKKKLRLSHCQRDYYGSMHSQQNKSSGNQFHTLPNSSG